jgi:hypothetical protein
MGLQRGHSVIQGNEVALEALKLADLVPQGVQQDVVFLKRTGRTVHFSI